MKKKVDPRVQILLQNSIGQNYRSIFAIIGDKGREQVVNIHQMAAKLSNAAKPKVLWCYKKDLGFTTHARKRDSENKKNKQQSIEDLSEPFAQFLTTNQIRYCYYAETQRILGNTYNMLVLQDFEAITPNILCRTIETVEGGGIIIFLVKTMNSLKQLYNLTMDVHSRLKTHQFQHLQPRFNERFILSLSKLDRCLFLDDELNLLPVSSTCEQIQLKSEFEDASTKKVLELANSVGPSNELAFKLIKACKTLDQAKIIMGLIDALQEKVFRYTINISAARGRGKSAAIGMAAAASIKMGLSNVFITAPSPENLNTFFEFLISSLELLDYRANQHYDVIQSTNPDFNKAIIRVNIYKSHRQFIQYIQPQDFVKVQNHADLVFCDEAAAIPLSFVKNMFGPYTLIMSSTINGYEGTGRSLSLKLISKLREQNVGNKTSNARILKELTMQDPIRYGANDPIERWLYDLLLLDATEAVKLQSGLPHPKDCELYLVNRDTLFSYQKASEKFLFNLMSLFIASHYKNSPNDLQLLSDAPAHGVFVLLGPLNKEKQLPDILCAIQVCFEGQIPKNLVDQAANQQKPSGDLIPWTLNKYYLDNSFPQYSGIRVIRIASHLSAMKMGYGSRAMELLTQFCQGRIVDPTISNDQMIHIDFREVKPSDEVNSSDIVVKKKLPPLLKRLVEVHPPQVDYIGVSYGLTKELYKFWEKNGFTPSYLSLRKNDTTGEYTVIVLKSLGDEQSQITSTCQAFSRDFRTRFISLLAYEFKEIEQYLSIDILKANVTLNNENDNDLEVDVDDKIMKSEELKYYLSMSDLQRLDNYCKTMSDFYLILDILPTICKIFFSQKCGKSVRMSRVQAAVLVSMGLQSKSVEITSEQLEIDISQILPLFNKAMRKMKIFFSTIMGGNKPIAAKPNKPNTANPSVIVQKRGKVNYEIDNLDEEGINLVEGTDVVTIGRDKQSAVVNYQSRKKVKK